MIHLSDLQGFIASLDQDFPKNAVASMQMTRPTMDKVLSTVRPVQLVSQGDTTFSGHSLFGVFINENKFMKDGAIAMFNAKGELLYQIVIYE